MLATGDQKPNQHPHNNWTKERGPVKGTGTFSHALIDPDRLGALIARSGVFAADALSLIDRSDQVSQLCCAVGIPGANQRIYGLASGSSLSMGGMTHLPAAVIAPEPPALIRRADLGSPVMVDLLRASVERVFRDAGATSEL